jgi:imidazolonepropionase-like amidohydrolase
MADRNSSIALVGGTLIDGRGGSPLKDSALLIEGKHIKAAGRAAEIGIPSGAQVIQAEGKTVMPGLIDAHVHIGTSGGGGADPREHQPSTMEGNFRSFLIHGVTTVMDMAAQPRLVQLQADLAAGKLLGPRLFGVKYGITAPGSHPIGLLKELGVLEKTRTHYSQVDTVEAARRAVRRVAADKPSGLKIYHSRSEFPGTMCLDCNREKLRPEVLAAIIDEAHANGLRVFAHIAWPSEAREVVEAGGDVLSHPITHAESGTAEIFDLMAERGVRMHSTMTRIEAYFGLRVQPFLRDVLRGKVPDPVLDGMSLQRSVIRGRHEGPGITEDARRILEITRANVRRANKAGVTIVMGTDSGGAGGLHGAGVPRELELLNESGLTPMQAIVAATRNAADVIGQGDSLGTLEPGKLADVLVIDGDPLRDISHMHRVQTVIKDGVRYDPAQLSAN